MTRWTKSAKSIHPEDANREISALIERLHETGQRLEKLTGGEVDTVTDRSGRTFLLQRAQVELRHSEAAKQAAILNALPAHIALLDAKGIIISVNEAWRRFAGANEVQGPGHATGVNYLWICDSARGIGSSEAHQIAEGIRSVLDGGVKSFSLEYPCHSLTQQCWFLLAVTPLADDRLNGAVVMHLNITERRQAADRIVHLNRVYAMLSGINALIVRVCARDELFKEACRIAVEKGGFRMAWIGIVDRSVMKIVPVASLGVDEEFLTAIEERYASSESAALGNTMAARAMREKKAVVYNDLQSNPEVVFGRQYAEAGIHSIAVLPLIVSDEAVGVIALYASENGFFYEEELKLLIDLTGDIAFAIDHIDKQERLDYLAYYDALTGLANRSLFLERVAQYIRSAVSGGYKLALCLIDLERFKNINDTLGRPAGDALLRQVAEWLTRNAGDVSLLARIDADHFAVVCPELKRDADMVRFLEKTMAMFLDHPFRLNDSVFRIAAKVGVALFPDDGVEADTLFKNAEAALKKTKTSGDRYLFYTQKMTDAVAGKLTLETQLRQALDNEEFVLHYQPKVNLATGKLTGAEALIRWNDPRSGLVPPDRFIPVLEEIGLIYEVGRWALRKAIEDYLRWRAAGLAVACIAVNVSPLQLRHRGFIADIEQALAVSAHAAAGLELEITESVIMDDVKGNIRHLQAIRAMGICVAIDDFGTGFSSLSYLSKLPVDTLKIDRSFVVEMNLAPQGLALVSTIINLAHSLQLKVVAEGVETAAQSSLLRSLGCDEMQGCFFSNPVSGEIFETRYLSRPALDDQCAERLA